jgi:type IV pilus assembly protein PilW
MSAIHSARHRPQAQQGFTLVEVMVALLIGLFLLGGLLTVVQDNKRTFGTQNQLAQLQDAERLGMTMMTDVIQATGYFPNPTANTATSVLLAYGAMAQGQAMTGTYNAAAPGDTITVRYATNSGDGILNCTGSSNTSGAVFTYVNTFSVVNNQLVCTRENGTTYPLINGVTNLSVLYGVNTTGSGNNVDTYMQAAQVTANADWYNVVSVRILLSFTNPLYVAAGAGQLPTITFQRLVGVMNKTGI